MTVFELHLAIDQKLQEQGSYQKDRIFAEAKDLALNEAQDQILEQIIDDLVGKKQVRLKHVLPLIEKNKELTIIQNYALAEVRSSVSFIPPYVQYILNCHGKVATDSACAALPTATIASPVYSATITFPEGGTSPYYNNFQITNAAAAVIYSAPAAFTNRFLSTNQKYELQQDIADTLNVPGGTRWVKWNNNELTIYSTTNEGSYTISYTGATATSSAAANSYTKLDPSAFGGSTVVSTPVSLRWIEPDHTLYQKLRLNKFTSPKKYEPFFTVSNEILWIYYAEDSIVTNVYVDYIRKPKKISLVLNRTSELDPSVHEQIVNRAVEILKKNIQDPSLQGDVQYNEITTRK